MPDWTDPMTYLVHKLWTSSVGTPEYKKADWKKLEAMIEAMREENLRLRLDVEHLTATSAKQVGL